MRRARILAPLLLIVLSLIPFSRVEGAGKKNAPDPHPKPRPIDWDKVTAEATDFLSKYVQINTTNPPGNETPAARFLKEKFLSEGIPAAVFESEPGRGIVAARLRGIRKHS